MRADSTITRLKSWERTARDWRTAGDWPPTDLEASYESYGRRRSKPFIITSTNYTKTCGSTAAHALSSLNSPSLTHICLSSVLSSTCYSSGKHGVVKKLFIYGIWCSETRSPSVAQKPRDATYYLEMSFKQQNVPKTYISYYFSTFTCY